MADIPASHPTWLPLVRVEGEADIAGANWTVEGQRAAEVAVVEGVLGVYLHTGTMVIFR